VRIKSNAGFTLVETLITAVILSTGLAACAILFSYSVATNIRSQRRATATLLVYDKLEELRSRNIWESGDYSEYVTVQSTDYLRAWTIRDQKATVRVSEQRVGGFIDLADGTITSGLSF
jgi:prepilin-type N-terminal cleavage/methylation domain-containing protein